jgi:hypothetical protein
MKNYFESLNQLVYKIINFNTILYCSMQVMNSNKGYREIAKEATAIYLKKDVSLAFYFIFCSVKDDQSFFQISNFNLNPPVLNNIFFEINSFKKTEKENETFIHALDKLFLQVVEYCTGSQLRDEYNFEFVENNFLTIRITATENSSGISTNFSDKLL